MTLHSLVATDIVHTIPFAIVAGTGYLFAGMVDWRMPASLLTGSIPAVLLVSLLAGKIAGWCIQLALAWVLIAAGV